MEVKIGTTILVALSPTEIAAKFIYLSTEEREKAIEKLLSPHKDIKNSVRVWLKDFDTNQSGSSREYLIKINKEHARKNKK